MHVGDMLIAGQGMADQNGVGALGVELAIGLIGDLERRQIDAAIERQRLIRAKFRDMRTRVIRLMRALLAMDRLAYDRLYAHHLLVPADLARAPKPRRSGH